MKRSAVVLALLALVVWGPAANAQWAIGPSVVISIPTSEFSNVSGVGGGFGVKVIRNLNNSGLGLRGDFAYLSHGKEFQSIATLSGLFPAELRHQSFRLAGGAQYSFGSDELKFYAGAMGGFYWFRTTVNINTSFGFFQAEGQSDAALGWNFGGGVQLDFGLGPLFDVGVEYQTIYNIGQSIEIRDANGEVVDVERRDITANEFLVKLGVTFFIGRK